LSSIATRRKKYELLWPRSGKEYEPSKIRKFLGEELDEHFPYPFHPPMDEDAPRTLHFVDRPVSETEVYSFFNRCHQYLHEPNPYKKDWKAREADCGSLLKEAAISSSRSGIYSSITIESQSSTMVRKVGLICSLGPESAPVSVAFVLSDTQEAKE
jgi:hypothetical protein